MWTRIETDQDVEYLLDVFGGFHDGCIREMHVWTGTWVSEDLGMSFPTHLDMKVRVLFQRQWRDPSAIELIFEQVVEMHVAPSPENYGSDIFEARLMCREGVYYWADSYGWTPDSPDRDSRTWIAAKAVSWRDASEWMGDQLRYAPGAPPPPEAVDGMNTVP